MIVWAELALAILKCINTLMGYMDRQQWIKAGYDKAFAEQAAGILAKTEFAKNVRTKIEAMDPEAVDDALRKLEPK